MTKQLLTLLVALTLTTTAFCELPDPIKAPASSAYLSGRASILLAEIKKETAELGPHAEALGTFAGNPQYHLQCHAAHLNGVKDHINAIRKRIVELHRIRHAVLPWQDQAITEVTSHAAKVAASTQAAILYLNENQHRLLASEYRDHLRTIADSSMALKETVNEFLEYEKAQKKVLKLQNELELADLTD
jgi:hypothetical protein